MKHCSSCGASCDDSASVCHLCGDSEWEEATIVDVSALFQAGVVLDPQKMAIYRKVLKQSYFWYKQTRFWFITLLGLVLCSFGGSGTIGEKVGRAVLYGVICGAATVLCMRRFRILTGKDFWDDGKNEALFAAVYGRRFTVMSVVFIIAMLIMAYGNWKAGSGIGFAIFSFFAGLSVFSAMYHGFWAFHAGGIAAFAVIAILLTNMNVELSYAEKGATVPEEMAAMEYTPEYGASAAQSPTVSSAAPEAEILGAELVDNPTGASQLIVTYEWTNDTNQPSSAIYNVAVNAYQNGIGLEEDYAFILEDDSSQRDVQPGVTIQVREAFLIEDLVTDVQVEITPWISFEYEVIDREIFQLQ